MTQMSGLDGKRAFVVGGFGKIGFSTSRALQEAGAEVVVLEQKGAEQPGVSGISAIAEFDAGRVKHVEELLISIEERFGPADILVNCAYPKTERWSENKQEPLDDTEWCRNVDIQMNAACLSAGHMASRMARRGGGVVINVASVYGVVGPDFGIYDGTNITMPPAYSAIKAGIINYSRYLASYYGKQGVRVNTVCPGGVESGQSETFRQNYSKRTAIGRLALPNEISGPILFLASDAASYVTGATLMVDGGWTAI
jgi:NAD(P)-dependent dehydrogenase (short-subunit alcohol dehydrogenase family)